MDYCILVKRTYERWIFIIVITGRMDEFCDEAKARIQRAADGMVNRLVVELETGGNVRFEEGSSTDVWLVILTSVLVVFFVL